METIESCRIRTYNIRGACWYEINDVVKALGLSPNAVYSYRVGLPKTSKRKVYDEKSNEYLWYVSIRGVFEISLDGDHHKDFMLWAFDNKPKELEKASARIFQKVSVAEDVNMVVTDDIYDFFSDCFVITDNPNHCVSNVQIQDAYKSWLESKNIPETQNNILMITKYIRNHPRINWSLKPKLGQQLKMTINNARVKVLRGLVLKASFRASESKLDNTPVLS